MFEKFREFMGITGADVINNPQQFLKIYSGRSFKKGLYRIHDINDMGKWTKIVENAFPRLRV